MNYNRTIRAALTAAVVQAIIVNFAPMLFLIFQNTYGISFSKISLLITLNFLIQLSVDLICAKVVDKIGYRTCFVFSHITAAIGLIAMAFLPGIMSNPYTGLIISTVIYAVGGGIIEVLASPIVEACPTENKSGTMSLLHSFYCWGHVAVILLTTIFFVLFGTENWQLLALLWALVPIINGIVLTKVPIPSLASGSEKGLSVSLLFKNKLFWLIFLMMICSGASEQSIIQWASAFAEKSLGMPKAFGDLLGPLSFAALMGTSRALYAKCSDKISLDRFMLFCSALCMTGYLITVFSDNAFLSLIGFAFCGFSVGVMWPGSLSTGAAKIKGGGTAMFALFAVAGDVGCSVGPSVVGFVSDLSGSMKMGILTGIIFPLLLFLAIIVKKLKSHS
ncbi:MAG: MFS transporter [Clostridia bacterium]|nr:MFS transporter [Clostridia bacterium]